MTLTVIATMTAKYGSEGTLHAALADLVEPTLAEAGCLAYRFYIAADRPASVAIIEEWTDEAALQRHYGTPHFKAVAAQLDELLGEPLVVKHYGEIA
ncbi:MAG TPA: putative quinol monooxygenase [Pseudonocardiaceae bacterium]|jgi:quinol monooxygenase YgiN